MRKPQKRELDEVIAFYVEKFFYIALYPLVLLLNVRKLHFASIFNTPLDRRLQTICITTNVFLFLAGAQVTFGLTVAILLFSKYGYIIAIYFTHFFLDMDKPAKGGRPISWVRDNPFWKYARDYCPVITVKDDECELSPNVNYLFAFHPHGVLSLSSILTFAANQLEFQKMFSGMCSYMCALPVWFQTPFFRDFLMGMGGIPSSRNAIKYLLNRPDGGNCVNLIVGGANESLLSRPGDVHLYLKKRFGFIKIALQEGCPIVPVFAFGETSLYAQDENPVGSYMRTFQDFVMNFTGGITFPSFHGRGVLQYDVGMIPYRRPVYVVVGKPLIFSQISNPNHEEIQIAHKIYIDELVKLFNKYKNQYMTPETKLFIQ